MLNRLSVLAVLPLLGATALAHAADVKGSKDHPALGRFAGATIAAYKVTSFDEAVLPNAPIEDDHNPKLLKAEGKITYISYRIPGDKSALEITRNYEQALAKSGFKVLFQCANDDCGRRFAGYVHNMNKVAPTGFGDASFGPPNRAILAQRANAQGTTTVFLHVMEASTSGNGGAYVYEQVVDGQAMQTGQVQLLDAPALQKALQSDGKVALYGVYFDTDKATLKPESKAQLDQMAQLLKTAPALKVFIVGHTDNQGQFAHNQELSQQRADAVVKALSSQYVWFARSHALQKTHSFCGGAVWSTIAEQKANAEELSGQETFSPERASYTQKPLCAPCEPSAGKRPMIDCIMYNLPFK